MPDEKTPSQVETPNNNGKEEIEEYSLELRKEYLKLKGTDGIISLYYLQDLEGPEREKFVDSTSKRYKYDGAGKVIGVNSMIGLERGLLVKTLHHEDGTLITDKEMTSWPGSIIESLATRAVKLCGLDKGAKEAAKND